MSIAGVLWEVENELKIATKNNGAFHSAHEGYAVISEELDELWDIVKLKEKDRNVREMRREAIQVAAMAIRFIHDVCDRKGYMIPDRREEFWMPENGPCPHSIIMVESEQEPRNYHMCPVILGQPAHETSEDCWCGPQRLDQLDCYKVWWIHQGLS